MKLMEATIFEDCLIKFELSREVHGDDWRG